jgi:NTP pyrophosphatase (non-canonical NTP hydrolase)
MPNIDLYKKAIMVWGVEAQLGHLIEECAELICAVRHCQRGRLHNMAEEIADVEIMLAQARLMLGEDEAIERIKQEKLALLRAKLEAEP